MAKRVCAWCGEDLGPADTTEDTHSICPRCQKKYLEELEEYRRRKKKTEKNPGAHRITIITL